MSKQEPVRSLLASAARMFRPGVDAEPAEPPSCCGECGGQKKKSTDNNHAQQAANKAGEQQP